MTLAAAPSPPLPRPASTGTGALRRALALVNWPGLGLLVGLVVCWQLLVGAGVIANDYVPSPIEVLGGLREIAERGTLLPNVLHTVGVVVAALAIATVLGVGAGLALGSSERVWSWVGASVEFCRSLPVIALVPVSLVVFGLSATSELVVAVIAATWPILMNTAGGVQQIHPRLHDVGRTLGLSRVAVFAKIVLPGAAPAVTVGLRIGMTASLLVTVLAEMVGNPEGIGYGLVRAQQAFQPAQMYAYVLVILVIGLVLNAVVEGISRAMVGRR